MSNIGELSVDGEHRYFWNFQKDLLPGDPPSIIYDWHFIADLNAADVENISLIIDAIRALRFKYMELNWVHISKGLAIPSSEWTEFKHLLMIVSRDVSEALDSLCHNVRLNIFVTTEAVAIPG